MEAGPEEFVKQIEKSAEDRLTKSSPGVTFVLQEQGGVKIAENDYLELSPEKQAQITSLIGITELASQLRHSLFEQASLGSMTDASRSAPELSVISNQDEFVRELLGKNPKLIDKLAEITAKARIFTSILDQQTGEATGIIGVKVKSWEHTIGGIARSLCSNEAEEANYLRLVENNITKLNNPSQRTTKGADGQPTTARVESYASRLNKLIQNPRAIGFISSSMGPQQGEALADNIIDEYLETAFTLNAVRVLDRIQRPLGFNGKFRKLTSCLKGREADPVYMQIIESNGLVEVFARLRDEIEQVHGSPLDSDETKQKIQELNDNFREHCRPIIERSFVKETDNDEAINLVDTKNKIVDINRRANEINSSNLGEDEKRQRLVDLDREMQSLLIPIANKIDRIFPHESSTNLIRVLEREDAVCAGKVNVLLAISKYLGINARTSVVKEILDNSTTGHVCYECDLPSGTKLIVDANFGNNYGSEERTDDQLITQITRNNPGISDTEIESSLKYAHLAIANARFISPDSRVLIYTTENTGKIVANEDQLQEARNNPNLLIRINPYTGQKEVWKASVPYPHLITFPDKDGYLCINSSFAFNNANLIPKGYGEIGIYLFRKCIEMNPYSPRAYTGLASLLSEEERVAFFEKIREAQPALYWEGISTDHALLSAHQGNLEVATQLFEETRVKNPSVYYKEVSRLFYFFISEANEMVGQEATKLKIKAKAFMEFARTENPSAFYSNRHNVSVMIGMHGDQIDKKIEIYQQFKETQETEFWNTGDYSPPFQRLMELYLEQAEKNPALRPKAIELANEVRTRNPRLYAKRAYLYASPLFLENQENDPDQVVIMLEIAKSGSEVSFFQTDDNITGLARAYEDQNNRDKAIALFEKARIVNPKLFWGSKYKPLYEDLVHLYVKEGQTERAISICEEARSKDQLFWRAPYSEGYSRLASLYTENKQLTEAIAICTEAQFKDPKFLNPRYYNSGYAQLASLYAQNGQMNEAIKTMQLGQETDENYWTESSRVFRLVSYYEKNNQLNEAVAVLEQVRERVPNYWRTDYYIICDLYQKSGNTEKSIQVRTELIKIYEALRISDRKLYYSLAKNLAYLYLGEEQIEKAIQTLEEGKKNFAYFHNEDIIALAELYLRIGNTEQARLTYQDLIEKYKRINMPEKIQYVVDRAGSHGIEIINT